MLATSHTATDVNHPDTSLYTRAMMNLKVVALLLGKKTMYRSEQEIYCLLAQNLTSPHPLPAASL